METAMRLVRVPALFKKPVALQVMLMGEIIIAELQEEWAQKHPEQAKGKAG